MNDDDTVQFTVCFPKGWSAKLCRLWLLLRVLDPNEMCVDANVYRYDSLFVSCWGATHGFWYGPVDLHWTFKKVLEKPVDSKTAVS